MQDYMITITPFRDEYEVKFIHSSGKVIKLVEVHNGTDAGHAVRSMLMMFSKRLANREVISV